MPLSNKQFTVEDVVLVSKELKIPQGQIERVWQFLWNRWQTEKEESY